MTTQQVEFTGQELLSDTAVAEPLIAGGVRCHGGFDDDGEYVSPRTKHRVPGITAWQDKHTREFGAEILDIPLETWPAHYPNLAQARHLVTSGVREPLIATLTRIGTVEGFGANIRQLRPENLQRHFDDAVQGTAIDHLGRGLFEAHGRDEAGWEKEAGHKDMWFAARDIAFENPTADVDIDGMLARMGFNGAPAGGAAVLQPRVLPDDVDAGLEQILGMMTRVLLIEISAFHTFAWAEAWLRDSTLVAGDGDAARLVRYIRADETPHVGYLRTALTEMRDRTWVGASGRRYEGSEMFRLMWDRSLEQSLGAGREANHKAVLDEVEFWCGRRSDGPAVLEGFHALADAGAPGSDAIAGAASPAVTGY